MQQRSLTFTEKKGRNDMTTAVKKRPGSFRLNMISRKTEAVFHLILGVFAQIGRAHV